VTVDILFTNFISTLTQKPESAVAVAGGEIKRCTPSWRKGRPAHRLLKGATEFLFEPGADQVLACCCRII